MKAFLTSIAPFEDWLNDLLLTFVSAWQDPQICEVFWRTEWSCAVPSKSIMMLCSKKIHLYWRSILLLCLTITILLLGYQTHTQRIALLTTACSWKHVLRMTNAFLQKASLGTSLEDRPHHQGRQKAFLFHFPQNLQALVRWIQSLPRSYIK